MITFLFIITLLLLFSRISSTPRSLSKKEFTKYTMEEIKSMEKLFYRKSKDYAIGVYVSLNFILYGLMLYYYLYLGSMFSKPFYVMSIIQSITVIISLKEVLGSNHYSTNLEDHKFNRLYSLFVVILDYVYYLTAIYNLYMLL